MQGVVTGVVLAGIVGRLLDDRRHNRQIEKQRGIRKTAAKVPSQNLAPLQTPEPAVQLDATARARRASGREALLIVLTLAAGPALLLLVLGDGRQLSLVLAVVSAIVIGIVLRPFILNHANFIRKQEAILEPEEVQCAVQSKPPACLTGTWIKDKEASESMAAAIELAELSRITRTAVKLIKGMQLVHTPDTFEMAVFSVIGWFKVREVYPMSGEVCLQKRRDLRRGRHSGRVCTTPNGRIRLEFEWPDPVGGRGYDEFYLAAPDELHVHSHMDVKGRIATYTTVYRKQH